jgi:tetratricopeptide (TPR) repeat protein
MSKYTCICLCFLSFQTARADVLPIKLVLDWDVDEMPIVTKKQLIESCDHYIRQGAKYDKTIRAELYFKRAFLFWVKERNNIQDVHDALRLDPKHSGVLVLKAINEASTGQLKSAVATANLFPSKEEHWRAYIIMLCAMRQARPDIAIREIEKAIRLRPQNQLFRFAKALVLLATKEYAKGEATLYEFSRLPPSLVGEGQSLHRYLGLAQFHQSKYGLAQKNLSLAYKRSPKEMQTAVTLFICCGRRDSIAECEYLAIQLGKEHPNHPIAIRCRAAVMAHHGDCNKAIAFLEDAANVVRDRFEVDRMKHDIVFYKLLDGKSAAALVAYDEMFEDNPALEDRQTRLRYAYAQSIAASGDPKRLQEAYQSAKQIVIEYDALEPSIHAMEVAAVTAANAREFKSAISYVDKILATDAISRDRRAFFQTLRSTCQKGKVPVSVQKVLRPLGLGG